MQYPITFKFKIVALAPQIFITDANGQTICYIKQKMFKLKEKIEIYRDETRTELLATIQANKVIDWSARYFLQTAQGEDIGSVGRRGGKSIFKAHYDVFNPGDDTSDFNIQEENPWAKVGDALFGEIPVIGALTGFVFNPKYIAKRNNGSPVMRLTKNKSFFESSFELDKVGEVTEQEELTLMFSFLMLNLLERARG